MQARLAPANDRPTARMTQGITRTILIVTVVVALAAGFVLASEMVLILFLGVLFGLFLCHVTDWANGLWPLSRQWSLAAVVTVLLCLAGGSFAFFFVQINEQISQASDKIDEGVDELRQLVREYPAIRSAAASVPILSETFFEAKSPNPGSGTNPGSSTTADSPAPAASDSGESSTTDSGESTREGDLARQEQSQKIDMSSVPEPVKQAASTIGQLFRTTFGLVVNSLLIFFVGLFLAVSPESYRDGVLGLVPVDRRQRAGEVLSQIDESLWRWLLGRFGSMLITGFGAYVLLMLIGVPMAGTLGILTGLLTFVPNIGAAVALMLAILFALPQGLSAAGMVLAAYLALQLFESYLVTPLIQQRQVSLPPAMLIAFQAIMGTLFGFLGAAVASPILAAGKKAIEMLYVEDYLEAERRTK